MTVSDVVAARVRQVRKRRDWSPADLAARCAVLGAADLTENVIENIESRSARASKRPRPVTVDELLALALALNVPPVCLLVPPNGSGESYAATATVTESRFAVRAWIRGTGPLLDDDDPREFYAELPRGESYMPGHMTSDGEAWVGPVQQGPPRPRKEDSDGAR